MAGHKGAGRGADRLALGQIPNDCDLMKQGRQDSSMARKIQLALLWAVAALAVAVISFASLIAWPDPLFAYSLAAGRIVVASDRPIPAAGGDRLLRDCERLLERSPLKAQGRRYHLYVANEEWRHRLFFLPSPNASGYSYYYGFGGDAFLTGANFDTGR